MQSDRSDISVSSRKKCVNPITGEEMAYAVRPESRYHSRPQDIPNLTLQTGPSGDDDLRYRPASAAGSGRSSAVSWGVDSGRTDRRTLRTPYATDPEDYNVQERRSARVERKSTNGEGSSEISVRSREYMDSQQARQSSRDAAKVPRLFNHPREPVTPPSPHRQASLRYKSGGGGQPPSSACRRRPSLTSPTSEQANPLVSAARDRYQQQFQWRGQPPFAVTPGSDRSAHEARYSDYSPTTPSLANHGQYDDDEANDVFLRQQHSKPKSPLSPVRRQGRVGNDSGFYNAREDATSEGSDSVSPRDAEEDYERQRYGQSHQNRRSPQNSESSSSSQNEGYTDDPRPSSRREPASGRHGNWNNNCVADDQQKSERDSDRLTREMQKLWKEQIGPKSKRELEGDPMDADLHRNERLSDTLVSDQLAKTANCEQNRSKHLLEAAIKHVPGMARGSIRPLHESKIRTASNTSDQLLAHRVRFSARLLVPKGHDAIRDLAGFFFNTDTTFTLYEYRLFSGGKTAKALPLLKRSSYDCCWGRCKGEAYSLLDIFEGNTLYIDIRDQTGLPNSLKALPILKVRITEVDEDAKKEALSEGLETKVPESQWTNLLAKLHVSRCPIDPTVQLSLKRLHERVRAQLSRRSAVGVWTALFAHYQQLADIVAGKHSTIDSGYLLSRDQLEMGLAKVRLDLKQTDLDLIWNGVVNPGGTSDADRVPSMHFTEYMRLALGEMNEARRRNMRKAYLKMDTSKNGYVTVTDIHRFYRILPSKQQSTDPACPDIQSFLDGLRFTSRQDMVTYAEFEIFYEGLSASIEVDQHFIYALKQAWNI